MRKPATVTAYINGAAPEAEEKISYGMPYYGSNGRPVYFAAFRDQVSCFSIMSRAVRSRFAAQLRPYLRGKVAMHFPLGTTIPAAFVMDEFTFTPVILSE